MVSLEPAHRFVEVIYPMVLGMKIGLRQHRRVNRLRPPRFSQPFPRPAIFSLSVLLRVRPFEIGRRLSLSFGLVTRMRVHS
jgi:hypothetical protein